MSLNRPLVRTPLLIAVLASAIYWAGPHSAARAAEARAEAGLLLDKAANCFHEGDTDCAIEHALAASELTPEDPDAWDNLSSYYLVRSMSKLKPGKTGHHRDIELGIAAAKRSSEVSTRWAYKRVYGDALLFALYYGYPIEKQMVKDYWDAMPLTGTEHLDAYTLKRQEQLGLKGASVSPRGKKRNEARVLARPVL